MYKRSDYELIKFSLLDKLYPSIPRSTECPFGFWADLDNLQISTDFRGVVAPFSNKEQAWHQKR